MEKKKKSWLLRRLWQYLGRNRAMLALALALSIGSSLLSLYGPKLSGRAINAIDLGTGQVDFDTVFRCAIFMAICYACSAGLTYLLNGVMIHLSRTVSRQMRHDIFENLTSLPVGFFDRYQTGDLISILTYDVDTVNQSLSSDLLQILQSVVTVTVSFFMMMSIAPELEIVFFVTIPATILFTRWLAGRVRPLFRKRSGKVRVLFRLNVFYVRVLRIQNVCRQTQRLIQVLLRIIQILFHSVRNILARPAQPAPQQLQRGQHNRQRCLEFMRQHGRLFPF